MEAEVATPLSSADSASTEQKATALYWLNLSSNKRHNQRCRWYGKHQERSGVFSGRGKRMRDLWRLKRAEVELSFTRVSLFWNRVISDGPTGIMNGNNSISVTVRD